MAYLTYRNMDEFCDLRGIAPDSCETVFPTDDDHMVGVCYQTFDVYAYRMAENPQVMLLGQLPYGDLGYIALRDEERAKTETYALVEQRLEKCGRPSWEGGHLYTGSTVEDVVEAITPRPVPHGLLTPDRERRRWNEDRTTPRFIASVNPRGAAKSLVAIYESGEYTDLPTAYLAWGHQWRWSHRSSGLASEMLVRSGVISAYKWTAQKFADEVIGNLPADGWEIRFDALQAWAQAN